MRNVFDQYSQPENKLTHSLVSSLTQDKDLLKRFLLWSVGKNFSRRSALTVIEQALPGQAEVSEQEAEKRGLPDACIFDDNGWILIIESKVASRLSVNQLERHYKTVSRREYDNPNVLVITTEGYLEKTLPYVKGRTWKEIYEWGVKESSPWARLFTNYFEVLEARMVQEEYLTAGTLTKFSGIPFGQENPYSYIEAKRLLKLLINEIKDSKALIKELDIDPRLPGRGAIKGTKGTVVWDYLKFREAKNGREFTDYPHLTFDISFEYVGLKLTIPDKVKGSIRHKIFGTSFDDFQALLLAVLLRMRKVQNLDSSIKPVAKVMQRHYPSQSHAGIHDAYLRYDLRTLNKSYKGPEKFQPEWAELTYQIMRNRRSNIQFQIGIEIPLGESKVIKTSKAIGVIEEGARALKPFLDVAFRRK